MSPIVKHSGKGDIESSYAIVFDTDGDIRQLEHVFNYCHSNVHEWSVCQIADSYPLNKLIGKYW